MFVTVVLKYLVFLDDYCEVHQLVEETVNVSVLVLCPSSAVPSFLSDFTNCAIAVAPCFKLTAFLCDLLSA